MVSRFISEMAVLALVIPGEETQGQSFTAVVLPLEVSLM